MFHTQNTSRTEKTNTKLERVGYLKVQGTELNVRTAIQLARESKLSTTEAHILNYFWIQIMIKYMAIPTTRFTTNIIICKAMDWITYYDIHAQKFSLFSEAKEIKTRYWISTAVQVTWLKRDWWWTKHKDVHQLQPQNHSSLLHPQFSSMCCSCIDKTIYISRYGLVHDKYQVYEVMGP